MVRWCRYETFVDIDSPILVNGNSESLVRIVVNVLNGGIITLAASAVVVGGYLFLSAFNRKTNCFRIRGNFDKAYRGT